MKISKTVKLMLSVAVVAMFIGCGGSDSGSDDTSNSLTDGGETNNIVNGKIDLTHYFSNKSRIKNYTTRYKFKDEDKEKTYTEKEEITVKNNTISSRTTYSDDKDIDIEMITNQNSITYTWNKGKNSTVVNRYVNIGDITFEDTNSYSRCTLVDKLTTFSHSGYNYSGNIIKAKCIGYGTSYEYFKKGLGLIASISEERDDSFDYYNSYYTDK